MEEEKTKRTNRSRVAAPFCIIGVCLSVHYGNCVCGASILETHTWGPPHIGLGGVRKTCVYCGEEVLDNGPIQHDSV